MMHILLSDGPVLTWHVLVRPPIVLSPLCVCSEASAVSVSLEECWDRFTQPETLDEENQWYCPSCKDHVQARKTLEVWSLPDVLVLHLKRFE